ncbi:hypothetical protein GCM10009780_37320 [Actinomadura alba]
MDARRLELGLTWDQVAALSGVHRETLRTIRRGTGDIRSLTKSGIEKALQWAAGSIDAILAGGDPTPIEPPREPDRPPAPEREMSPIERELLERIRRHEAELERLREEDRALREKLDRLLGESNQQTGT